MARRSTRKPLTAAQQVLAERYLPLARSMARQYKQWFPTQWEEFESAACMALVQAAQSFDPSRGFRFATFARYRINGAMRDVRRYVLNRRSGRGEDGSKPAYHQHDQVAYSQKHDDPKQRRHVLVSAELQVGGDLEAAEEFERLLQGLPETHRAVCRLIYRDGKPQIEAARKLGYSQSRISSIRSESMQLLREAMSA